MEQHLGKEEEKKDTEEEKKDREAQPTEEIKLAESLLTPLISAKSL